MNQTIVLIFLIFLSMQRKGNKKTISLNVNNLDIDNTYEKINILRKIGPYFPEEIIPILNKSLLLTEKIVKIYEVKDFVSTNNYYQKINSAKINDNKERFNYIISTLREEIPEEEIKAMGYPMNMILNYDKYKYIMNIISIIISNPQSLNNPNELLKASESLMDGMKENEKEKVKDMMKMFELMKALEPSNKEKKDPKTK
ncbi:hypothetical protein [Sporanaerobacter acetigenes]|uniref:Uncharacterized protein n=1 Tax=Sporanaerobacter acetigenes DSM 13106 TaxID=1123281 RepID=A0A1M5YJG7_9FIRM|nr:hypothetical protein [Sporanaerobacter acetigenes]SHI12064.1 hypothetical protein SAMN02745180_02235 [Sporanaerobacter acetigenes DSM 13106]